MCLSGGYCYVHPSPSIVQSNAEHMIQIMVEVIEPIHLQDPYKGKKLKTEEGLVKLVVNLLFYGLDKKKKEKKHLKVMLLMDY